MACVARQTTFFLFPILIIPVLDMESPQRDPRPPTLPTTIQAGPDATHDESAYPLLISPELRIMRHPTISRHHPSMLVLTLSRYAHTGWPYLAVLGAVLGPITLHIAGQYCTTEIRTVSRHLCPITTRREKRQKDSKMSHPLYTKLRHLPYLSASFTSALTLHIDTN